MHDPARLPHRPRPGRHRATPQTWPLTGHLPTPSRLLVALGYGAGAALVAFALVLAVAGVIV